MKRKLFSVFLAFCVCIAALPMSVFAGDGFTMPNVGFEVRMNPRNSSQYEQIYQDDRLTLEVDLTDFTSAYIKPYVDAQTGSVPWNEHEYYTYTLHNVIDNTVRDDNAVYGDGKQLFGIEKRFNDENNTTSKNWIVADALEDERIGDDYYQIEVKCYQSNSLGQEQPATDQLLGTSVINLHVKMYEQKNKLYGLGSYDWEQSLDKNLEQIYATPEEFVDVLNQTYGETVGYDMWGDYFLRGIPVTWELKTGTTYDATPGAQNIFVWKADPEKAADFDKWSMDSDFSLEDELTFTNPYALAFETEGTVIATKYVKHGGTVLYNDFPQVPEKKGYTGTWNVTGDITNVTANQTIQAVYTPISYTISYEMDGGTNPADNPTSYNVEQDIVLKDPSKSGYQFTGWTYEGQTTPQKNLTLPAGSVSGNLTFTAHWEKNSVVTQSYALHYETNGGEDLPHESKTSHWVKAYEELPVPEKTGYIFAGWHEDEELTKLVEDDVIVNRTKITLYAKWEKDPSHPDHTGVSDVLNTEDHMAYLEGYPGSKFMPEGQMTRAEVAQMFYNLLLDKQVETTVAFEDVADNAWYADAIHALASMGILEGREGNKFDPDTPITRAEFATIAVRFASQKPEGEVFFQDVSKDAWYYSYVTQCAAFGWIEGYEDDTFRPDENIRRGEAATIVNRMLGRQADEEYIDSHSQELASFVDLSQDHWAYYHIMEAINSHDYEKKNGQESWTGLKD